MQDNLAAVGQDSLLARLFEIGDNLQASGVNVQSILLEGYHHTLIFVFAKVASLKLDEHKNVRRDYELAMQACQIAIFIGG